MDSDEEDSDDDDDEEDSDDEDESSEEEDSDDEEDSEDEEESEPEEEEKKPAAVAAAGQKRKEAPVASPQTPFKKAKSEGSSNVVFVGNLSWNVDQDSLAEVFSSIGGVVSARIITDRDSGRPKGFGYVDFETSEQAQQALELKGTEVDGRPINVDLAQQRQANETTPRAQKFGDKIGEPSTTLFVGNMSFHSSQDSLYELFGQTGEVVSVRIPTDKETGQVKGYQR